MRDSFFRTLISLSLVVEDDDDDERDDGDDEEGKEVSKLL